MNKKIAIILIVAAFLIGVVGGGWRVNHFLNRTTHQKIETSIIALELGEVGNNVAILTQIRSNNLTNGIDRLESNLDGSLLVLIGSQTFDMPQFQREQLQNAFRIAKDYRNKFPHENEQPEVSRAITKAFSLVGK